MTQKLGRLDLEVTAVPGGSRVTMKGRIDDSAPISQLAETLAGNMVTIDTDGVTFVNSIGVREWMRLLRGLAARSVAVRLERVADVLLTQMNMIPDAKGAATILSFHAQYVCNACGAEAAPVIDAIAHAALLSQLKAPQAACDECGAAMELGDYAERYLSIFVK
jgi:DNA-directed RNA polymerase subunit RPC12/RpoP